MERIKYTTSLVISFWIALVFGLTHASAQQVSCTMFREHGLDVSWDRSGSNRIAYSQKNDKGFYNVHLADPDGSHDTCLTCNSPLLPDGHNGSGVWHPSGKWLLITCEKPVHKGARSLLCPAWADTPISGSSIPPAQKPINC